MGSNVFHNKADISAAALEVLTNSCVLSSRVNREYDKAWSASGTRIGDTYNVRIPGFVNYRTGAVAQPTGYTDTYVPVVLAQSGAEYQLTSKERTLNIDAFKENVIAPIMTQIANQVDAAGHALIAASFPQFAGKPGTAVSSANPFLTARAILEKQSGCTLDGNISGMLDADVQTGFLTSQAALFNPNKVISEQYRNGSIGNAYGIDFFSTANAPAFAVGTWAASIPAVASPTTGATDGGTTLNTAGWAASAKVLNVGDAFTIAGVYAVNPVTKATTSQLKQFRIATKVSDSSATTTITLDPPMILTGTTQNINALPAGGARIYMWANNATDSRDTSTALSLPTSFVFHKDALVLALADMEDTSDMGALCSRMRDPKSNFNSRMTQWYDANNDKSIIRADVLTGWSVLRQGFGCRVVQ